MECWFDTYPHKVYTSVLLLDGKLIDYKIGQTYWQEPFEVTLRGQINLEDLFKCEVRNTFWEVNNSEEHLNVFDELATEWINEQIKK